MFRKERFILETKITNSISIKSVIILSKTTKTKNAGNNIIKGTAIIKRLTQSMILLPSFSATIFFGELVKALL
jgi:hypothetical protein